MDYHASDRKGEVCVKGDNVFAGYLNDPEKTKEAIDEEGWLHTGDIGVITERGERLTGKILRTQVAQRWREVVTGDS